MLCIYIVECETPRLPDVWESATVLLLREPENCEDHNFK